MDIIDLIKQEQQKIMNLLVEICQADIQRRYTLFNEISQAVDLLAEVKQRFYSLVQQQCPNIIEQITITEDEYERLKSLMTELELLSPATKEFEQKVYEVQKLASLYIHEEEKVIEKSSKHLTNTQRQQLAQDTQK